ncbi:hypothetical protein C3F09_01765 [candidate division GN15 bacterium]|uniref:Uncharacterized protein n=1 Tax=candidate division GN15 bacterium TaxID=2072418 RepID=A0A855X3Z9_9BACT|nr:MAG: hypothetical protein C3F09_01765 [candidate division GN15 bacterium]
MVEEKKQAPTGGRVTPDDRFHYIGFEVYPGKGGDIFKSEAEKTQLVEGVRQKRSKGDIIREQCSLLLARVTGLERTALTVACVIILASIFAPWYSAYNTVVDQSSQSAALAAQASGATGEEVITGAQVRPKTHNVPESLSGIGALISIGSVGGAMFSSGFALILTALIMLVYTLLSIALPIYVLMALYKKGKESADEAALRLKKILRYNWVPVILLAAAFVLSFFGSDYASGVSSMFTSFGTSYGPGVFLGSMSWGLLLTVGGFFVLAFKGIEI